VRDDLIEQHGGKEFYSGNLEFRRGSGRGRRRGEGADHMARGKKRVSSRAELKFACCVELSMRVLFVRSCPGNFLKEEMSWRLSMTIQFVDSVNDDDPLFIHICLLSMFVQSLPPWSERPSGM